MEVVPITSGHAAAYMDILKRTTPEDRYLRFFSASNYFTLASTAPYVTPAPEMLGFIAFDGLQALGVAHAFVDEDNVVEISILIANDSRRRGVGRALIARLLEACGKQKVVAYMLTQNIGMRLLALDMGFKFVGSPVTIQTMVKDSENA
jgi:L-amino acid N-acyltransferase YncA